MTVVVRRRPKRDTLLVTLHLLEITFQDVQCDPDSFIDLLDEDLIIIEINYYRHII